MNFDPWKMFVCLMNSDEGLPRMAHQRVFGITPLSH